MSVLGLVGLALLADVSDRPIVKTDVHEAAEGYALIRAAELPPSCKSCRAGLPSISVRGVRSQGGVLKWSADALDIAGTWLVQSGDWQLVYWCAGVLDFEGTAMVHLQEGAEYVARCSASAPWSLILEQER